MWCTTWKSLNPPLKLQDRPLDIKLFPEKAMSLGIFSCCWAGFSLLLHGMGTELVRPTLSLVTSSVFLRKEFKTTSKLK